VSCLRTFVYTYCVTAYDEIWLSDIRNQVSLLSSVFTYRCEQLFTAGIMNNVKSRTRTHLIDEHLEGYMRIVTAKIKLCTELKNYLGSVKSLCISNAWFCLRKFLSNMRTCLQ
jgi:hypothetical protein